MQKCTNCEAENQDAARVCFLCHSQLKKPGLLKRLFGSSGKSRRPDQPEDFTVERYGSRDARLEESIEPQSPMLGGEEEPVAKLEDATDFKERGTEHLRNGQYELAVEANGEAIRIDPKYTDAYYNRGLAFIHLGLYHEAIQDLGEAIVLDSTDPDAYHNRAYAFFMLYQLDRSIEDYDQSIYLNNRNPELYIGRGAAYFEKGEILKSVDDFDQAISLGHHPLAYANRAVSYVRLGRLPEAESDVRLAQEQGFEPEKAIEELKLAGE